MPSQPYRVHPNFAKILKGTRQSLIDKNDNWLPLPMLAKLRFPIVQVAAIRQDTERISDKRMTMTPEEQQRLQACIQEIAQILYNSTLGEKIATLQGIEKAVRQQMREHVSPKIALFLWKK
jgi:hypothetical protein